MLQTIEVEIDYNGVVHPIETTDKLPAGRALLTLLEPVSYDTALLSEQALAEDWLKPDEDKAWANLQTKQIVETKENPFDDLFGIIKTDKTASLEDIERAISQRAMERFNDSN